MLGLKPFLTFSGNCEEAVNYYRDKLDGEILSMMHFGEGPMDVPEAYKKKVMYSEFKFGDCKFMASDNSPGGKLTMGNNISMSVGTTDLKKIEKWFNNLAKDGKVTMPLQDTFWGARFGMLTDKFGIQWMFNCELKKT
jgi:PhnB protein